MWTNWIYYFIIKYVQWLLELENVIILWSTRRRRKRRRRFKKIQIQRLKKPTFYWLSSIIHCGIRRRIHITESKLWSLIYSFRAVALFQGNIGVMLWDHNQPFRRIGSSLFFFLSFSFSSPDKYHSSDQLPA